MHDSESQYQGHEFTNGAPPEAEAQERQEVAQLLAQLHEVRTARTAAWRARFSRSPRALSRVTDTSFLGTSDTGNRLNGAEDLSARSSELQLFRQLESQHAVLRRIPLQALPAELFSTDRQATAQSARTLVSSESLYADYLEQNGGEFSEQSPYLEKVLLAYERYLQQQLFLRVGSDLEQFREAIAQWVHSEGQQRSIQTDTYTMLRDTIDRVIMGNGPSRKIALAILYGEPGTGKTEFLMRYLLEVLGKQAVVISMRPHISYEELVGRPELFGIDRQGDHQGLIQSISSMEAVDVVWALTAGAEQYATSQVAEQEATRASTDLHRTHWYLRLGLSEQAIVQLQRYASDSTHVGRRSVDAQFAEQIKRELLQANLAQQLVSATEDAKEQYLRGLLLAADMNGCAVILDEAEKPLVGKDPNNQSFAGLEHFLTVKPGDTFQLGSIQHTISSNFAVCMSMNTLSVPKHILSRFSGATLEVSVQQIDRLKILIARTSDQAGRSVLSPEVQMKLEFFVSTAWSAFQEAAEEKQLPWDLRNLDSILSALVAVDKQTGQKRSTQLSFASACAEVVKHFPEVWQRFPQLHDWGHGAQSLFASWGSVPESAAGEEDDLSLLRAVRLAPVAGFERQGWTRELQQEEVAQLQAVRERERAAQSTGEFQTSVVAVTSAGVAVGLPGGESYISRLALPSELRGHNLDLSSVQSSHWGDAVLVVSGAGEKKTAWVLSTVLTKDDSQEARVLFSGEVGSVTHLSPAGDALCTVSGGAGQERVRLFGVGKESTSERHIELPFNPQASDLEFTPDGRYLILPSLNERKEAVTQVIDLQQTLAAGRAVFLYKPGLPGSGWSVASHQHSVFAWLENGHGICFS